MTNQIPDLINFDCQLNIPTTFSGGIVLVRDMIQSRTVSVNPSAYAVVIELLLEDGQVVVKRDHSESMGIIRHQLEKSVNSFEENKLLEWSFAPGYEEQPPLV